MARRQIEAMILADPTEVTFRRRTKTSTPDGGWKWGTPQDISIGSQQVCLIPFKRRITEFLKNTELGDVSDLPYVLLGRHTLDIQKDDLFTVDNQEFQVITIDISEPEVKLAAQVDYFGGGIND
jgi:hypothetical protein